MRHRPSCRRGDRLCLQNPVGPARGESSPCSYGALVVRCSVKKPTCAGLWRGARAGGQAANQRPSMGIWATISVSRRLEQRACEAALFGSWRRAGALNDQKKQSWLQEADAGQLRIVPRTAWNRNLLYAQADIAGIAPARRYGIWILFFARPADFFRGWRGRPRLLLNLLAQRLAARRMLVIGLGESSGLKHPPVEAPAPMIGRRP